MSAPGEPGATRSHESGSPSHQRPIVDLGRCSPPFFQLVGTRCSSLKRTTGTLCGFERIREPQTTLAPTFVR